MSSLVLLLLKNNVKMGVLAITLETIIQVEAKSNVARVPKFQSNESIALEWVKGAAVHSTVLYTIDILPVQG